MWGYLPVFCFGARWASCGWALVAVIHLNFGAASVFVGIALICALIQFGWPWPPESHEEQR